MKGSTFPGPSSVEQLHELVAVFIGQERIVKSDFRNTGNGSQDEFFEAGLSGSSDRNRVAITAQAGSNPKHIDLIGNKRLVDRVIAVAHRLPCSGCVS